jgi:CPA2 family monovalent cation:H+ antiporter-2
MSHELELILTLTGGLAAALVFGYVTDRLRLSPIVGYLVAGIAVGPFTPGFVASSHIASQLADVGVILLMFGVGIHFDVRSLAAVRKLAVPGAIVQSAASALIGALVARGFGWGLEADIVFGIATSVASTVVLVRVLADNNALQAPAGRVAIGWLLVEDLLTVIALVILPLVLAPSRDETIAWALGKTVLELGGLCAFMLVVGGRVLPRVLAHVARTSSRELFTLSVLVIALGMAVAAARWFGASMALGAFLAGMVVGQSDLSARAAAEALPLRDAFAVLFFVAMGMLFDPQQFVTHLPLTMAMLAVVVLVKPLVAFGVVKALRGPTRTATVVALALAQIGEFSFIVNALGLDLHVLPPVATQSIVAVSIISITLNPLLFKLVEPLARWLGRPAPPEDDGGIHPVDGHVIVVGYGPVGQQVVALLLENGLVPIVIELDVDAIRRLRERRIRAVYGDASQRAILEAAGLGQASGLVFASNAPAFETVKAATSLRPDLPILTRTTYLRDAPSLRAAGASVVVSELEVALSMTERLLERFGSTADQLDRARARVRDELAPPPARP